MSAAGARISRRSFLAQSAAACAATVLPPGEGRITDPEPADLVLLHGKVITVNASDSIAQAVAVRGDEIVAVGSDALVDLLIGPSTQVIDLAGKTVTPGIVDSHLHALYYGRQFWDGFLNIRYPVVKSLAGLLAGVQGRAQATPAGQWISGNQGFMFTEGPAEFGKTDLDTVAPLHPVYLRHASGQYSVVNSLALTVSDIDVGETTDDPYGGKIVRDPVTNEATGVLLHYPAENLVMLNADGYKDLTTQEMENDLKRAQRMLLSAGITSIQDVIVGEPSHMQIYKNLADRNELKVRSYMLLYINTPEQAEQYAAAMTGYTSDFVTFGGWKLAIDGGIAAGTSLMVDDTLPGASRSYYYYDPDTLNDLVDLLHGTGMQISFHITGDLGIDEALDALELAGDGVDTARHRIEHAFFVTPDSLARIVDLGVSISVQPQTISFFGGIYRAGTSDAAMANFLVLKDMLDDGVPLAFGCDVPAMPWHHPKWALHGATTRRALNGDPFGLDQALNMHQALRVHTMGSAYAAYEEGIKGSIEVGKLADLVVWSDDWYSIDSLERIAAQQALITIVGGEVVYRAPEHWVALPTVGRGY